MHHLYGTGDTFYCTLSQSNLLNSVAFNHSKYDKVMLCMTYLWLFQKFDVGHNCRCLTIDCILNNLTAHEFFFEVVNRFQVYNLL